MRGTALSGPRRYLAAACSFVASTCAFASTIFTGAALPLWRGGFVSAVAAALLAVRAQGARPAVRSAWLLGMLGVIVLGVIVGFAAGALLRGG
jgi:small-conductance mechanosensitive channel